jgi:4-hydroxy-tetrahydrodipicolinate synthase
MNSSLAGVIPPIVTPFSASGEEISEENLRKVIRHVMSNGCSGVFVGGSQGEFFSQRFSERVRTFEIAVDEAAGKFPVLAGSACISTSESVELTKEAKKAGVSAVSVINPFFIGLDEEELYAHFAAIADSVDIPMFLYNNPGRTHQVIPVSVVDRLAKIGNIVGMKDSSGDLTYVNAILDSTDDFLVFCGRDTCIFNEMASGAAGAVAASANVAPALVSGICSKYKEGDLAGARKAQAELVPLREAFSLGSFPVVVKEALQLIGIDAGPARLPVKPMTEGNRMRLRRVLEQMGLIPR